VTRAGLPGADAVEEAKRRLIEEVGPWTTPVYLGEGVRSCEIEEPSRGTRLRRLLQIVEDVAGGSLDGVRILDLACLEGMVSVELARRGATVLGIEVREGNVARARFAKEVLGLDRLEIAQDDVRNLSREKYGSFDVVLCLGILYHLPAPDVFAFAERIAEVTERFALFDTHVALPESKRELLGPPLAHHYRGRTYEGRDYREFDPAVSEADRLRWGWSTIDARPSFWPTRGALLDLLTAAGFTSLHESHTPPWLGMAEDRVTLVAFRGKREPDGADAAGLAKTTGG
jgi:SAM-dependent methyltransferase